MDKVIYFTQSIFPTEDELAEIELFNASNRLIAVRSANPLPVYGETLEACDFVAGAVPEEFAEKPVATPGGGAPLPEGLDMLGLLSFRMPQVTIGTPVTVIAPTVYSIDNGVLSQPTENLTIQYAALPPGSVSGWDGQCSFTGNELSGVTAGTAGAVVILTMGALAENQKTFQIIESVVVVTSEE